MGVNSRLMYRVQVCGGDRILMSIVSKHVTVDNDSICLDLVSLVPLFHPLRSRVRIYHAHGVCNLHANI